MWIILLGAVGLVAGLALVLGLERQYARPILIFAVLGLLVGVVVGSIRVVPAGHVGVVDFFGTVSPTSLKSGINFVNPLAKVISMSIRTQEDKETMSVPSKEGLTIELEISALFHLFPEKAVEVYKTVGPEYAGVLFVPQFRAAFSLIAEPACSFARIRNIPRVFARRAFSPVGREASCESKLNPQA